MNISKMTAGQIAEMSMEEFNSLTAKEARDALKKVRKSVNQRLDRLSKHDDVFSPAAKKLGRLKPQTGMNRNQTLSELKRGINFLNSKTGTISGARTVQNRIKNDLGLSGDVSNEEIKDIYKSFHEIQEEFPSLLTEAAGGVRYAEIKRKVGKMFHDGKGKDEIRAELKKIYQEKAEQAYRDRQGVESEF